MSPPYANFQFLQWAVFEHFSSYSIYQQVYLSTIDIRGQVTLYISSKLHWHWWSFIFYMNFVTIYKVLEKDIQLSC